MIKRRMFFVCVLVAITVITAMVIGFDNNDINADDAWENFKTFEYDPESQKPSLEQECQDVMNKTKTPAQRDEIADQYSKIMEIQERAVYANDLLTSSFNYLSDHPYPDDYAGDYISDEGMLTVYLTSLENVDFYKAILEEYTDVIDYKIKNISLNDLTDAAKNIGTLMKKDFAVVSYGPDMMKNCVNVDVAEKYKIENELILSGYMECSNECYRYRLNDDSFISVVINWDSSVVLESAYAGGSPLGLSTTDYDVTMACNGYRSSTFGFVTCGHGQIIGHMMYSANDFVGVTGYISFPTLSNPTVYGDFSFINAVSIPGNTIIPDNHYKMFGNQLYTFTGTLSNPAVGTYLYSYGMTSGVSLVQVSSQNNTTVVSLGGGNTGSVMGITKATILSGASQGGDSGGPYVYQNRFSGIHQGKSFSAGGPYALFTPYTYVQAQSISAYV